MTRITPLEAGDTATVQQVFDAMSPESRYRRYHGPVTALSPRVADRLAAVDGQDHVAVVATTGWIRPQPVGIARLVRTDDTTAEFAVEVADAAQGRGIGRRLVAWARDVAPDLGIDVVVAEVLVDNGAMRRLLSDAFPGATTTSDGRVVTYRCRVGDNAWRFDAADLLRPVA